MLLAFDTGNTNTVIGLYDGDELCGSWRFATDPRRTVDEYGLFCFDLFNFHQYDFADVDSMIISSVVPDVTSTLAAMGRQYFQVEPLVVEAGIKTGLPIRYENPKEVGADRIVNAVAAIDRYGTPCIIVDFGTATTFCVVNEQGEYMGGAITTGIGISMDALFSHAAKLPKVDLKAPPLAIGRNTVNAMQSGLVYGYAGLVDAMIVRLCDEMGYDPEKTAVVATGGRSDMICKHTSYVDKVDMKLTIHGLRILADRNRSDAHD